MELTRPDAILQALRQIDAFAHAARLAHEPNLAAAWDVASLALYEAALHPAGPVAPQPGRADDEDQ